MADIINLLNCFSSYGNTGTSNCDVDPGTKIGDLLVPHGFRFAAADVASEAAIIAAIQTGLTADSPNQRFYFLGNYEDITPQGGDAQRQTGGYGNSRQIRPGNIADQHQIWGGLNKHGEYFAFNGSQNRFDVMSLFLNESGYYLRGETYTTAGATVAGGSALSDLSISNYMYEDGSNGGMFTVTVGIQNATNFTKRRAIFQLSSNPFDAGTGLITVKLTLTATSATAVTVTGLTAYGVDIRSIFSTQLAQINAWVVRNAVLSSPNYRNAITVTAVTATGAGWALTLAAPGTDPDNPGTGGRISIELAVPSALAQLTPPVTGIATIDPGFATIP